MFTRVLFSIMKKNITQLYQDFCESKSIPFQLDDKVSPYDDTTLFCPAGMQQFKKKFSSDETGTMANIQSCVRLKDLEEIGDGTHFLHFRMIGLFSFREMTLQTAVDFWMEFIEQTLCLNVDYITIHPDKMEEWKYLYDNHDVEIREDDECIWTDGEIGGYCTEFYHDDVEIGNIVNTVGTCIDVGFGLERLDALVNGQRQYTKEDILKDAIVKMLDSGYYPSNKEQGYVLRKLLRELYFLSADWDNKHYREEQKRQDKTVTRYEREKIKKKNQGKSKEWYWDTLGVDVDLVERIIKSRAVVTDE